MAIPVISILMESNKGSGVFDASGTQWKPGVIKAGRSTADPAGDKSQPSRNHKVQVWNNKGAGTAVSDMIECTVCAYDSNGKHVEQLVGGTGTTSWFSVLVNDSKRDSASSPGAQEENWQVIGAAGSAPIWSMYAQQNPSATYSNVGDINGVDNFDVSTSGVPSDHHQGFSDKPEQDHVISGAANDGSGTGNSQKNFAECEFQIDVPTTATPGSQGFKIRFQGYYV